MNAQLLEILTFFSQQLIEEIEKTSEDVEDLENTINYQT